jgi:hypothetical protein
LGRASGAEAGGIPGALSVPKTTTRAKAPIDLAHLTAAHT